MNSEKYIGLDVHQATISVAVMDSRGKVVMESILETKATTILEFFAGLRGTLSVTFEEGTWAAWLYDLLKLSCERLDDIAKDRVTHSDRRADDSGQKKVQTADDRKHGSSLGSLRIPNKRNRICYVTRPLPYGVCDASDAHTGRAPTLLATVRRIGADRELVLARVVAVVSGRPCSERAFAFPISGPLRLTSERPILAVRNCNSACSDFLGTEQN